MDGSNMVLDGCSPAQLTNWRSQDGLETITTETMFFWSNRDILRKDAPKISIILE